MEFYGKVIRPLAGPIGDVCSVVLIKATNNTYITKTRLFKYIENFTTKTEKFSDKNSIICYISAQNIDYVYLLEPPQ